MLQIITTHEELQSTIDEAVNKAISGLHIPEYKPEKIELIRGIVGLAKFLKCSRPTAQRLKNSDKIPYYQHGRTLVFKPDEVLEAMRK